MMPLRSISYHNQSEIGAKGCGRLNRRTSVTTVYRAVSFMFYQHQINLPMCPAILDLCLASSVKYSRGRIYLRTSHEPMSSLPAYIAPHSAPRSGPMVPHQWSHTQPCPGPYPAVPHRRGSEFAPGNARAAPTGLGLTPTARLLPHLNHQFTHFNFSYSFR